MVAAQKKRMEDTVDITEWWKESLDATQKAQELWLDWFQQCSQQYWGNVVDPSHVQDSMQRLYTALLSDPDAVVKMQTEWWQCYMELTEKVAAHLADLPQDAIASAPKDRRFRDSAWETHPLFRFIREAYSLSAETILNAVEDVEGMDPATRRKVAFYTRQFVDAMSPSNFWLTNPEVLKETIDRHGENLVEGFRNFMEDVERGGGRLQISMTDYDAFKLGENIAATPGSVVYENKLMQLIQYAPATKEVYKRPLLLMPAWINKYYILDLQQQNSLVKWLTEQGYTVFMISWVNPDESYRSTDFEDYMVLGPLAALDAIEQATGEKEINAVGYCLGGTMLSLTMAWLAAKGDNRITSATLLTTMLDFNEPGELCVFLDEEQIGALDVKMQEKGVLDAEDMMLTFNLLRANELIWSFFVNNYLMGKEPFPFDLLYWNADGTNLPGKAHSTYLHQCYLENRIVKPGAMKMAGQALDLGKVKTPICFVSCHDDHIAPWKSTYAGRRLFGGDTRFILAGSGHIAGVVNSPDKNKYGYWEHHTGKYADASTADEWLRHAIQHPGSWWGYWESWLKTLSGDKVPARTPGSGTLKPIEPAPGRYVKVRVV